MTNTVNTVGLYVRDQDEALAFYVGKLGFEVHTDVRNGSYRWLTVRSPGQDGSSWACSCQARPPTTPLPRFAAAVGRQGRNAAAGAGRG